MDSTNSLGPDKLYRRCDPNQFTFKTTADVESLEGLIGQTRAVEAVQFGIGIRQEGYNLYVLGPHGTGKHTAISQFLEQKSATEPVPNDWCYVNNFENPQKPRALRLPAGQACVLQQTVETLIQELHTAIPATFDGDDYRTRKAALEEALAKKQDEYFNNMQQRAKSENFALIRSQAGLAFAPLREGQVISPEDYQKLPKEEQEQIETRLGALQNELQATIKKIQQLERKHRENIRQLDREIALFAVGHLLDEIREKFSDQPAVLAHLDAMQNDIVDNVDDFRKKDEDVAPVLSGIPVPRALQGPPSTRRYQINVLVNNTTTKGAPVVYQNHPTYPNLIGRMEHIMSHAGTLITDFTLIRPGSLHQANGGYLIIDAHKVLRQPETWEALKRLLRAREITIESLGQQYGVINTISLEPEPIPLDVKIVLIGDRMLYYLLCEHDPDFSELFKVVVDFEEEMDRTPENNLLYARLIGTLAKKESLRHFDRTAVARVIEHSSRMVGDSAKLSTRMQGVADLLREADYWAGQHGNGVVTAADVEQAINAQMQRNSRIRERMQEQIERGTILIDTDGEQIGQINGLSVLSMGQFSFGRPSRITARVRLGRGKFVDIEREVELGGPLHSKG
ncbi:MAG: ATP-dependent protease, partial [Chloroflexi bacterium]